MKILTVDELMAQLAGRKLTKIEYQNLKHYLGLAVRDEREDS